MTQRSKPFIRFAYCSLFISLIAQNLEALPPAIPATDPAKNAAPLSQWLNVAPLSLAKQRLAQSTFPTEAEVYCDFETCELGLTHGFVLGGDVYGMATAPLQQYLNSHWVSSGHLTILDTFGGVQLLGNQNDTMDMNAQLGYRKISFSQSSNEITTQGLTAQVHYTQQINAQYSQGLNFQAYMTSNNASLNNPSALNSNNSGNSQFNDDASFFYRISQNYPTVLVGFPADFELINWDPVQTQLEAPLRVYAHVEPLYVQNQLNFANGNTSYQFTEQDFGGQFGGTIAYVRPGGDQAGRYSLKGSVGVEVVASSSTVTESSGVELNLPVRSSVAPYLNLGASWAF